MALKTPYATALESDTFLASKSDWVILSDEDKDMYLLNATYYLDKNYSCTFSTVVEDEAGYACSLLAYHDFVNGLYNIDTTGGGIITEQESKAGDVAVKTKYSTKLSTSFIDPYPEVSAILGGLCSLRTGNTLTNATVVRT